MGFGDFAKGFGKMILEEAQSKSEQLEKRNERIEQKMDQSRYLSDKELISKFKSASGDSKIAYGKLLKERGYGNS